MRTIVREDSYGLPILHTGWSEEGDNHGIQFYNVYFREDFGPFRKGEELNSIHYYIDKGKIIEYGLVHQVLREVNVKLIVV